MPAKKYGGINANPGYWNLLVTGASGKDTTVSIHVVNRNPMEVHVDIALTSADPLVSAVPPEDTIYYRQLVYGEDSRQFRGIVVPEGVNLVIYTSSPNITCIAYGFEEAK